MFVIKNGLRWRDAPRGYGPHKTIYNRFMRWSRLGVFNKIFAELGVQGRQGRADHDRRHAPEGPPHRRQPFKKGPVPRRIGRTKGGLNSKLHAVCDGKGRPLVMLLSEGQMSDFKGAAFMLPAMPGAKELLADKGYDADWFRAALAKRRIAACIPPKSNRKTPIPHDAVLYKQRHKIENMFGRPQGLAAHPHPIRPLRPYLLLGNLHRRGRHLLAVINGS